MVNIAIPVKIDHRRFVTMHFLCRENPLRVLIRLVDNTLYVPDVFSHLQIRGQVPYNTLCLLVCGRRFSGSNVLLLLWLFFCLVVLPLSYTLPTNVYLWFLKRPKRLQTELLLPVCCREWCGNFFFTRAFIIARTHSGP